MRQNRHAFAWRRAPIQIGDVQSKHGYLEPWERAAYQGRTRVMMMDDHAAQFVAINDGRRDTH
jgi:hypothetical protein